MPRGNRAEAERDREREIERGREREPDLGATAAAAAFKRMEGKGTMNEMKLKFCRFLGWAKEEGGGRREGRMQGEQ